MPQFGASLADNSRDVIYNRNMFIVQASGMGQGTKVMTLGSKSIFWLSDICVKQHLRERH
jgi:hypothetical protein